MTDIISKWKTNRFVVVPSGYADKQQIIILTDNQYWSERYAELDAWCEIHGAISVGMTVDIPSDEILTLFCLKWT